jgi:hypothetical protein
MGYTPARHTSRPTCSETRSRDDMVERIEEQLGKPEPLSSRLAGGTRTSSRRRTASCSRSRPRGRCRGGDRPPGRARRRPPPLVLRGGVSCQGRGSRCARQGRRAHARGGRRRAPARREGRPRPFVRAT